MLARRKQREERENEKETQGNADKKRRTENDEGKKTKILRGESACNLSLLFKTRAEGRIRVKDISVVELRENKHQLCLLTTTHEMCWKVCRGPLLSFCARHLIEAQAKLNRSAHTLEFICLPACAGGFFLLAFQSKSLLNLWLLRM